MTSAPTIDISSWRKAMEGVTPGEWAVMHHAPDDYYTFGHAFEVRQIDMAPTDKHHWPVRICTSPSGVSRPQPNRDGDWIARCSPSAITALLDALEASQVREAELRAILTDWLAIGNDLSERRKIRDRARAALTEKTDDGN